MRRVLTEPSLHGGCERYASARLSRAAPPAPSPTRRYTPCVNSGSAAGRTRRAQMGRIAALLFGAAAVVTLIGLALPHQRVDETGLAAIAVGAAADRRRLRGRRRAAAGVGLRHRLLLRHAGRVAEPVLQRRALRRRRRQRRDVLSLGRPVRRILLRPRDDRAADRADRRRLRGHAGRHRPRRGRRQPLGQHDRPDRRRRGGRAAAQRAHRRPAGRAALRGAHRPPHRPAQPPRLRGRAPAGAGASGTRRRGLRRADRRPRRVQGASTTASATRRATACSSTPVERSSAEARRGDLVARLGGDEFALLLPDTTWTAPASWASVSRTDSASARRTSASRSD